MHAKRIIPCLDSKNGRVVKGTSFVNLRDAGDPVEAAVAYDRQEADELVLWILRPLLTREALCWILSAKWRKRYLFPLP